MSSLVTLITTSPSATLEYLSLTAVKEERKVIHVIELSPPACIITWHGDTIEEPHDIRFRVAFRLAPYHRVLKLDRLLHSGRVHKEDLLWWVMEIR